MKQTRKEKQATIAKDPFVFKSAFKKLKAAVMMQLKDKMDFSWTKSFKGIITKTIFTIALFAIVTVATKYLLNYALFLGIFFYSDIIRVCIVFFTVLFLLSTLSCTIGLMKSLFEAEDNKVLTTLPLTGSTLFFSKLIVYYIYELKKNFTFLFPLMLGFFIQAEEVGRIGIGTLIYAIVPFLLIISLPVLLGAILAIPALYIKRVINKIKIIEIILVLAAVGAVIYGSVYLIQLIPENINLTSQWPIVSNHIMKFLRAFIVWFSPLAELVYLMTGRFSLTGSMYRLGWQSALGLLILIGVIAVLIVLVYFLARPMFFKMMSKSFEFDKKTFDTSKPNKVHKPFITFVNKEFKINFRSVEISGNYLAVYIIVPVLILLLNSIFGAMDSKMNGMIMTYSFNLLLILLPLLASNAMIATLYSKEGNARYTKKTKPVDPLMPLISKLLFNLIFCVPSIFATMFIFGDYANLDFWTAFLLALAVLLIQYGHIFYSATLDIMNPMSDQYQTEGESISNPNENKATVVAFIIAILFALVSYKLFNESLDATKGFVQAAVKLFFIALAIFGANLMMFILKTKAYYYEK